MIAKPYVWVDAQQRKIKMEDMSVEQLQASYLHCCMKEIEHFKKVNSFNELRDQLQEVAEAKGVTLRDPDETNPKENFGSYYANKRRTKAMKKAALLGTETVKAP